MYYVCFAFVFVTHRSCACVCAGQLHIVMPAEFDKRVFCVETSIMIYLPFRKDKIDGTDKSKWPEVWNVRSRNRRRWNRPTLRAQKTLSCCMSSKIIDCKCDFRSLIFYPPCPSSSNIVIKMREIVLHSQELPLYSSFVRKTVCLLAEQNRANCYSQ